MEWGQSLAVAVVAAVVASVGSGIGAAVVGRAHERRRLRGQILAEDTWAFVEALSDTQSKLGVGEWNPLLSGDEFIKWSERLVRLAAAAGPHDYAHVKGLRKLRQVAVVAVASSQIPGTDEDTAVDHIAFGFDQLGEVTRTLHEYEDYLEYQLSTPWWQRLRERLPVRIVIHPSKEGHHQQ